MAEPHTLKIGDVVTHPEWRGETRVVVNAAPFRRLTRRKGRYVPIADPKERVIILDRAIAGDDGEEDFGWMEAGLDVAGS